MTLVLPLWVQAQQPVLIYIGDPMCSWCYGIAPELDALRRSYPNMPFEVVLGGLRPGGTETMAELGDFLDHHWHEVAARSGQPFNHAVLKDLDFVIDTEPACRAVVTMRALNPGAEMDFFKRIQKAFFVDNHNMSDPKTFADLAAEAGVDRTVFLTQFESQKMKEAAANDFHLSAKMGVRGFPTVLFKKGEKLHLVANGYSPLSELESRLGQLME